MRSNTVNSHVQLTVSTQGDRGAVSVVEQNHLNTQVEGVEV